MTTMLLSKLIKACEMDWIPESDALFGEPEFLRKPPQELKQLVYRSKVAQKHKTQSKTAPELPKIPITKKIASAPINTFRKNLISRN